MRDQQPLAVRTLLYQPILLMPGPKSCCLRRAGSTVTASPIHGARETCGTRVPVYTLSCTHKASRAGLPARTRLARLEADYIHTSTWTACAPTPTPTPTPYLSPTSSPSRFLGPQLPYAHLLFLAAA